MESVSYIKDTAFSPTLCSPHRGSWAGRFPQSRLCRVQTYGTACPRSGQTGAPRQARASFPLPARLEPTSQGARPEGPLRCRQPRRESHFVGHQGYRRSRWRQMLASPTGSFSRGRLKPSIARRGRGFFVSASPLAGHDHIRIAAPATGTGNGSPRGGIVAPFRPHGTLSQSLVSWFYVSAKELVKHRAPLFTRSTER